MTDLNAIAQIVDDAAFNATAIPQLSESGYAISLQEAYEVQKLSIKRRFERGEKLIGIKMGFTSKAKQVQMGLEDEIWGRLTDKMWIENGAEIDIQDYVHPRFEPELAFRIKHDINGVISREEAIDALDAVAPAIEIIDSRYANFKFNLPDVVADNSSSSSLVVGEWMDPNLDFRDLKMALQVNGQTVQEGSSLAILGDPIQALMAGSRLADTAGIVLKKDFIVMAGGATAAHALSKGDIARNCVEFMNWPCFSVKF